ncbi:uncharacterized protein ARMOST_19211 [Armillaria ostoyae]|uniref:DUF6534 domain-containing protein n=1 Tax=Armillaria ostoyae TaxID=47428 RepID=A0A284S408_ARMOS|nr:uncharacterized protein ARMOST_19211 [Armillaria ostoyae]
MSRRISLCDHLPESRVDYIFRVSNGALQVLRLSAISHINISQKLLESIWAVSAIVDILISASLLSILWIGRRDTFKSTTQILHRLSIVIVNTGLWTSAIVLIALVGLVVWEVQDVYAAFSFIACPLYCNTLLANLNTRGYIQKGFFPNNNGIEATSVLLLETHTRTQRDVSIPLNDQFTSRKIGQAPDSPV